MSSDCKRAEKSEYLFLQSEKKDSVVDSLDEWQSWHQWQRMASSPPSVFYLCLEDIKRHFLEIPVFMLNKNKPNWQHMPGKNCKSIKWSSWPLSDFSLWSSVDGIRQLHVLNIGFDYSPDYTPQSISTSRVIRVLIDKIFSLIFGSESDHSHNNLL